MSDEYLRLWHQRTANQKIYIGEAQVHGAPFLQLSPSCFFPKIFTTKSRSRCKIYQMYSFLGPQSFREG